MTAARPTIRVEHVARLVRSTADWKGTEPIPGIDGQVVYEIHHPDGHFSYMHQPFARGPHSKVDGRNVWSWEGAFETPTLTPSYLCVDPANDVRVHLFLKEGRIELCGDSTVQVG